MSTKKAKKTFRRYVVIRNCKVDFGFGPGVIGRDEITFTDARGRGFDSPLFQLGQFEQAEELMKKFVTVLIEPKVKGQTWNRDPKAKAKIK